MIKKNKIKVGISHGDINGISYEVILKTLLDPRILEMCTPIIYGSPKVAAYHRKALNIDNLSFNHIRHPGEAAVKRASIINCIDDNIRVELGKSTSMAGESSYMALERAVNDLYNGDIDVLVTAPINKKNIQSEKFSFPGHTEYLTQKFGVTDFLMMMVSEQLRIGVATGHIPLSSISEHLTKEMILSKLTILHRSLIEDFTITSPRIAVLGLNPHAGDDGLLGKEEQEVIVPAIREIRDQGMIVMGPYPADGFFGSGDYARFDATLAMYHDQGMAPFKLVSFEKGVNFTAGLPVVRTSPDHGTAYNIAGEGKASHESFREALYLAIDIFKHREIYAEISKDPLKKSDINPNHVDENIDMEANEEDSDV